MEFRRQGRSAALQVLCQLDAQEALSAPEALGLFWRHLADEAEEAGAEGSSGRLDDDARDFATRLVEGVESERAALDRTIAGASRNWRLERMARVDRNLLRLGLYEVRSGISPAREAVNEAVELAKRYGTAESAAFVHGLLDRCLSIDGGGGKGR
jgi:N utilization substance protein B